jgi:hypothetical protein
MIDTLARDIAALHTAHIADTWRPTEHEAALAVDLAHAHWTSQLLRAALRRDSAGLPPGPLAGVLEAAAVMLERAPTSWPSRRRWCSCGLSSTVWPTTWALRRSTTSSTRYARPR